MAAAVVDPFGQVEINLGNGPRSDAGVECDAIGHDRKMPFVTSMWIARWIVGPRESPRGPAAVVEIWGEALIASCLADLVEIAAAGTRRSASDAVGQPLIPHRLATPEVY